VHVALVILWQQCNMLCISIFVDDIMFAHSPSGQGERIWYILTVIHQMAARIWHSYIAHVQCLPPQLPWQISAFTTTRDGKSAGAIWYLWLRCLLLQIVRPEMTTNHTTIDPVTDWTSVNGVLEVTSSHSFWKRWSTVLQHAVNTKTALTKWLNTSISALYFSNDK